jgi:hypothetical protein
MKVKLINHTEDVVLFSPKGEQKSRVKITMREMVQCATASQGGIKFSQQKALSKCVSQIKSHVYGNSIYSIAANLFMFSNEIILNLY